MDWLWWRICYLGDIFVSYLKWELYQLRIIPINGSDIKEIRGKKTCYIFIAKAQARDSEDFHHDGESVQEETEQRLNGYINRVWWP